MDADDEAVWRLLDLALISDDDYQPYRTETSAWAAAVDWATVNTSMRDAILSAGDDAEGDGLVDALDQASQHLGEFEHQGLISMWHDPITAFPVQIISGGHRITAMKAQGLSWTVGYYRRGDTGHHIRVLGEDRF